MNTIRLFRHHVRPPFLVLASLEGFIFFLSVYGGVYLRLQGVFESSTDGDQAFFPISLRALVFMITMLLSVAAMGLYQAQRSESLLNILLRLCVSYLLGVVILSVLVYLIPQLFLGRGVFLFAALISFTSISIVRVIFINVVSRDILKRRVTIFGSGDRAAKLNDLRQHPGPEHYYIRSFIQVPGEKNAVIATNTVHLNNRLVEYALEEGIDEIVVALDDRRKNFPLDDLLDCRLSGIDVIEPITFLERETGKVSIDLLHPSWLIFTDGFNRSSMRSLAQRIFDVIAASLLFIVSSPILLATTVSIWLESAGRYPILYRQIRVGQNGIDFELLKFRSMKVDAEQNGVPQWAQENDERITRVGHVIRRLRIDELPQLLNILRGDMSLVGPRPERPEFVKDLSIKIPYYKERHRVKPGLTGWAQLKYPYGSSEQDAREKLQFDLYYVKNHNLLLDFFILIQTAEIVLWGKGAR